MAETRKTLIKAAISLIISLCVMSVCVLSVFGYTAKEKKLTGDYSFPKDFVTDNNITSQNVHQRKFSVYTHTRRVGEEGIVTIYSTAQINELNKKRAEGEWYYLTDSEVLYLIMDTLSLFEKYDKVCVVDINGAVHIYNSQDYRKSDRCEAIAIRLEVLCSAFYRSKSDVSFQYFIMNECTGNISDPFLYEKYLLVKNFYFNPYVASSEQYNILRAELLRTYGSAFIISNTGIYYINELSRAMESDLVAVY